MNSISKLVLREPETVSVLMWIWESNEQARHHFLSEQELDMVRGYVERKIKVSDSLYCMWDLHGGIQAFMVLDRDRIALLCVNEGNWKLGCDLDLSRYAIHGKNVEFVELYEKDEVSVQFYKKLGFLPFAYSTQDSYGRRHATVFMRKTFLEPSNVV